MAQDLPTLVLVHGSWHQPACFDKLIAALGRINASLRCVAVALPSASNNPSAGNKDDIDVIRAAITAETDRGRDVVLLVHSYGGFVGASAVKGLTAPAEPSTTSDSAAGYVKGMVYITSGFTFAGFTFMTPFLGIPPPYWRCNKDTGYAEFMTDVRQLFYHDLPREEGEYWVGQITNQSLKSLFEGGEHTYPGWRDLPVWYIGASEDHAMPPWAQRMMIPLVRGLGARVTHRELRASHSPFLSVPDETAAVVVEAVEALAGVKVDEDREFIGAGPVGVVPGVRLLSPVSWMRYGLPWMLGWTAARSILAFTWVRGLFRR